MAIWKVIQYNVTGFSIVVDYAEIVFKKSIHEVEILWYAGLIEIKKYGLGLNSTPVILYFYTFPLKARRGLEKAKFRMTKLHAVLVSSEFDPALC